MGFEVRRLHSHSRCLLLRVVVELTAVAGAGESRLTAGVSLSH